MKKISNNHKIADYYKRSNWLYKYFWYSKKSLALHYGYWDKDTQSHDESLTKQYDYVIDNAKISDKSRVLDAGCGVGGGVIYIAQKCRAVVSGISLSLDQIKQAKIYSQGESVVNLVDFSVMDYTKTSFPNDYFDVIYGIESVCYATPKRLFLDEAFRILKPGGILIISDGYRNREPVNDKEKSIIEKLCHGWRLNELISVADMNSTIIDAKFNLIKTQNKTKEVGQSLKRMGYLTFLAKPAIWLSKLISLPLLDVICDNAESMDMSRYGVELGLFGYYTHLARKPKL